MKSGLDIAFFGSSLVSAYWNGAATYYRGMIRALAERGHRITFYEPDAFQRQQHRDMEDPSWARDVVYAPTEEGVFQALFSARDADVIVKASGVGVFDELLEREVLALRTPHNIIAFWDVDAPATLERVESNAQDPFRDLIPQYDLILTYGGGPPVIRCYEALGARQCIPIYNALDPSTHFPVPADPRFQGELGFLGNRMPDREARVHDFFFKAARLLPAKTFVLGGSGWDQHVDLPSNVRYVGHVYTRDHNTFNTSSLAVLNINRDSMARFGYSPPTRVFEAAGAAACVITDAWQGIELFLEPTREVLVAHSGEELAELLDRLRPAAAQRMGEAALKRILAEHTYAHRAVQFEQVLQGAWICPTT